MIANAFFLPHHLLPEAEPEDTPAQAGAIPFRVIGMKDSAEHGTPPASVEFFLPPADRGQYSAPNTTLLMSTGLTFGTISSLFGLSHKIVAKQNDSKLHMVSVEEIDYMPEFVEEVREETGTAARRFHIVLQRARAMAEESQVSLNTHVVAGHPVRSIVKLAADLKVALLVIGAIGQSALYERLGREPRGSHHAPCPLPNARCLS